MLEDFLSNLIYIVSPRRKTAGLSVNCNKWVYNNEAGNERITFVEQFFNK
jgi:hypothetical protein